MHLDLSIVWMHVFFFLLHWQIIKGCGVGKFDQGANFGRFDCTFRDVCSRINRLVLDGYVKRDENNQHMLAYIQDPTAAVVAEVVAEGGKEDMAGTQSASSNGPKEDWDRNSQDGVLTIRNDAPQGHDTLEQKDRAPVDDTDLPDNCGQQMCSSPSRPHSRKRHGASKPPVVRLKRKPQVSRMCVGGELYDREDLLPLVSMFTSTNSRCISDVQAEVDQTLSNISQVLHTDVDIVEHLLIFCHWNKDNLIQVRLTMGQGCLHNP